MADNKNKLANSKKIQSDLDLISKQVNDLYTSTYYTSDNSEEFRSQITDKLDDAIKKSTQNDENFRSISNTSKLFKKLLKDNTSDSTNNVIANNFGSGSDNDISTLFQNNDLVASLMDSYAKTKWITELDNEYRLICKYMPKLQSALDIKRDAVLCSDSQTKEFLTIKQKGENSSNNRIAAVQNNISEITKKYKLHNITEKWYEETAMYGEAFIYCVPYSDALRQLLNKKKNTSSNMVHEASITFNELKKSVPSTIKLENTNAGLVFNVKFDHSKIVSSAIENNLFLRKAAGDDSLRGLSESFMMLHETNDSFNDHFEKSDKNHTSLKFDSTINNEIEWEDDDKTAKDGLVDTAKNNNRKLNVNGAIVKMLGHDKVIPIYIEDSFFGVYYIEVNKYEDVDINSIGNFTGYNGMTSMFNNSAASASKEMHGVDQENNKNILLKTLAYKLSQKIDAEFINANVDLKEEIYQILKFNDKYNQIDTTENAGMNIVFIPADDVYHLKFREDAVTHRGISDLWDSLVPAKQWITMNLTSILGWTTRGFDRRLYYVKQSLDTNTAQSLLNVISTIKKGNFGIRQMESVNNILNIVGRFNDFVVPMGPSGEAPIQFDTQAGQNFEFPNELMQNLEESAINPVLPIEIVNSSTAMDFAVRYTMTNAKLLRNVLKRQMTMEDCCSEVFTKIYRFEYNENIDLEATLPVPVFLGMTQGAQLLNQAVQYADAITEVDMAGKPDEAKQMFKKRVIRKFVPSYLKEEDIQDIKDNVAMDLLIAKSRDEDEI